MCVWLLRQEPRTRGGPVVVLAVVAENPNKIDDGEIKIPRRHIHNVHTVSMAFSVNRTSRLLIGAQFSQNHS